MGKFSGGRLQKGEPPYPVPRRPLPHPVSSGLRLSSFMAHSWCALTGLLEVCFGAANLRPPRSPDWQHLHFVQTPLPIGGRFGRMAPSPPPPTQFPVGYCSSVFMAHSWCALTGLLEVCWSAAIIVTPSFARASMRALLRESLLFSFRGAGRPLARRLIFSYSRRDLCAATKKLPQARPILHDALTSAMQEGSTPKLTF